MNSTLALIDLVFDSIGEPARLGRHDCCQFAARCADLIGGTNLAESLRGQYQSWPQAVRFAHEHSAEEMLRIAGWVDADGGPRLGDIWIVDDVIQVPYLYVGRNRLAVCSYPVGTLIVPALTLDAPLRAKLRHSTWVR